VLEGTVAANLSLYNKRRKIGKNKTNAVT